MRAWIVDIEPPGPADLPRGRAAHIGQALHPFGQAERLVREVAVPRSIIMARFVNYVEARNLDS